MSQTWPEPVSYLDLLVKGLSCQEISKQLGLSREHVSRVYRKKAVELVTEEFLSVVKRSLWYHRS